MEEYIKYERLVARNLKYTVGRELMPDELNDIAYFYHTTDKSPAEVAELLEGEAIYNLCSSM